MTHLDVCGMDCGEYDGQPFGVEDTGSFWSAIKHAASSVGHAVSSAAKKVGAVSKSIAKHTGLWQAGSLALKGAKILTNNPVWNIAATGASFIPGVGTAVSAGMGAAAALGRGQSLGNAVLAAGRNALPGGPAVKAAFDIGLGVARGHGLSQAALGAVRGQLPGGDAAKAAFDAAVTLTHAKSLTPAHVATIASNIHPAQRHIFTKALSAAARHHTAPRVVLVNAGVALTDAEGRVALAIQRNPSLRLANARRLAAECNVSTLAARNALSILVHRFGGPVVSVRDVLETDSLESLAKRFRVVLPVALTRTTSSIRRFPTSRQRVGMPAVRIGRGLVQALYNVGHANIRRGILSHGLLARVARETGELQPDNTWTIRTGDNPSKMAAGLTGNGNRWRELVPVNPGYKVVQINGVTQISPWRVGQRVVLPPSWLGVEALPPPNAARTYRVQPNDTASKIALLFTGDKGRWPELVTANPAKPRKHVGQPDAGNFTTLYAGESLHVPTSWPMTPPSGATPATTTTTTPVTPVMAQQSIAYVQTLLAFWVSKHALEAQGLSQPLYGTIPGDMSGVWDARTSEAMKAFQRWDQIAGGIVATGQPDARSIAELEKICAADAKAAGAAVPATTPATSSPATSSPAGGIVRTDPYTMPATTTPAADHPAAAAADAATAATAAGATPAEAVKAGAAAAAAASSTPPPEQMPTAGASSPGGGGYGTGALIGAALLGLQYL